MVLFSKFETASEFGLKERMIGGVFEGSNEPDFSQKDTLYVINRLPERLNTAVNVYQMKKYKYVRYYGRPGVHCNVSEIAFFENMHDTIPLKGEIIGTPGSADPYDPHEYTNALDGKTWTSFDYKERSGGWVGLKFPEPTRISKIVYTPRNRDNYIRPGDDFELFYLDKTWKSLGQIQSTADSIVYENVPKDALLYLKCHSRGSQEWIFTYEDGKQNWL